MIQNLPREIIILISKFIDPHSEAKVFPQFVFRYQPQLLIPLSQTSRSLRSTILPLLIKQLSFIRKYELQVVQSTHSTDKSYLILELLKGYEFYVEQVEIYASLSIDILQGFNGLQSLTILGDSNKIKCTIDQPAFILKHLATALPRHGISSKNFVRGLRRLDLLISTDFSGPAISTFQGAHELEELNITTQGPIQILTWKVFVNFLSSFRYLKQLSIRKRGTRSSQNTTNIETSPFSNFIRSLSLANIQHFSIDMIFLRAYAPSIMDYLVASDLTVFEQQKNNLHLTLIEPSLAGPFTTYQEDTVLSFLNIVSGLFSLKSLKLVYGLQTEIPTNTSVLIFQSLITKIYLDLERRYESLKSLETVYSLMAWNIRDDNEHFHSQILHPYDLLSHDTDGRFSPNYQKLLRYDIKVSSATNGIYLLSKFLDQQHSKDYDFWSSETISKDLIRFLPKERNSNIWD